MLDSFLNLQQTIKVDSAAMKYLLAKFGFDIGMMIEMKKGTSQESVKVDSKMKKRRMSSDDFNQTPQISKQSSEPYQVRDRLAQASSKDLRSMNHDKITAAEALPSHLHAIEPVIFNANDGIALRQDSHITPKQIDSKPVKAYSQQRSSNQDYPYPSALKVRSQRFGKIQAETTIELYVIEQEESEQFV